MKSIIDKQPLLKYSLIGKSLSRNIIPVITILVFTLIYGCSKPKSIDKPILSDKSINFLKKNVKKTNINVYNYKALDPNILTKLEAILHNISLVTDSMISAFYLEQAYDYIHPPYALAICNSDTTFIALHKEIEGYTKQQITEATSDDIEYEVMNALSLLYNKKDLHIAFIEGHNELARVYTYDAEKLLSIHYNISRGQIGNNISELDDFDAIIIAGPKQAYSINEKYIIDQYIMRGGRVLWLVEGAYFSVSELAQEGYSATIKNDVFIDDMLFTYGVRINPDFVMDEQSAYLPLVFDDNKNANTFSIPDYYTPLLNTATNSPITKDIGYVKTSFVSSIDTVKTRYNSEKKILLYSSDKSNLTKVPDAVTYEEEIRSKNQIKFDKKNIPVAISLRGTFESSFANRVTPQDIEDYDGRINKSKETRMIVISSSDIIRNDVAGHGNETRIIPMGYDLAAKKQYANHHFLLNAINWLTDDDNWMDLRMK